MQMQTLNSILPDEHQHSPNKDPIEMEHWSIFLPGNNSKGFFDHEEIG